ncbi:MAG: SBBP repeat-containing protein, partial [Bryobacteraceae bacterium]|nr:SBBP repeat-containing protein [Bryobacteraceae bacterium]
MKAVTLLTALLCASAWLEAAGIPAAPLRKPAAQFTPEQAVLPLVFEENAAGSGYVARTPDGAVHLGPEGAVLLPRGEGATAVKVTLPGAARGTFEALDPLPSVSNYFIGKDPSQWRTGVRHFGRVRYRDVYPGVDLVYYGAGGKLEYDVVLSAGADKRKIEVEFEGAKRVTTNASGDLDIVAGGATIRQLRPRVYQTIAGVRKPVEASYRVTASNRVQFALGKFDRSREVVIDPVIQYATYVGRSGQESVSGVAVDAAGNAYISGDTTSIDLSTGTVFQNSRAGDNDAFVAKVSPNGTILFISYLGGKAPDSGLAVAAD